MSTSTGYPPNESPGGGAAVSIRRYVNNEIAATAARFDASGESEFEFVCECGDLSCRGLVKMTLAEYTGSSPGSVVGH